jgi:hypothetical protein
MRWWMVLMVVSGCGGEPGRGDADADPATGAPVFDDGDNMISITEGAWPGVGDPWAGVHAWFSDTPDLLTETARAGSCRVRTSDTAYCEGCEGVCISGVCHDWPRGRSAGEITITGLAVPLTLTWTGDYYSQQPFPPDDVFDAGDAITVTADGDEVAGFTAGATGVEAIAPRLAGSCDNELRLTRGEDAEITWPDPVPGARVRLRLPSPNNGHGMPPRAVIECEGPDAGRMVVPAALIDALPDLVETEACDGVACVGVDCPPSSLARYTRAAVAAGSETIELRVQSEVLFYLFDD